jgi:hypothetical protein
VDHRIVAPDRGALAASSPRIPQLGNSGFSVFSAISSFFPVVAFKPAPEPAAP